MNKSNCKLSLADKIASVLNTAPSSYDPDDDSIDATDARILSEDVAADEPEDEQISSKFRRANVDLLANLDDKYAGKKISRRNFRGSSTEFGDKDVEESEVNEAEENFEEKSESEGDSENSNEEIDFEEEEETNGDLLGVESQSEVNFKHMSDSNVFSQIKKCLCVKNQMAVWENLLEIRIQLQKCLLTANKMPQIEKFNEIKSESGQEFISKVNDTKQTLFSTIDKLQLLQKLLLNQFPETKKLRKENSAEEIASDTEEESEKEEFEVSRKKKRRLEEYEKEISNWHNLYKDYRNKVIQKWNNKTRTVTKNSVVTSHSILDQIQYNLSNKDKLIKRTQTRRSQYKIFGEDKLEEFNTEIFDDDDFYHQLLKELIEVKSADVIDPIQLSRQWIQIQNLRSKMKRKVDTRATKGRKIRYAVHNKLVNFMAPVENSLWSDEAKNELYNSLFGKNV